MKEIYKNRIKGIISGILSFIFCFICIPTIAAIIIGAFVSNYGEEWISLGGLIIVIIIILSIPLAFWSARRRYRQFNPPRSRV